MIVIINRLVLKDSLSLTVATECLVTLNPSLEELFSCVLLSSLLLSVFQIYIKSLFSCSLLVGLLQLWSLYGHLLFDVGCCRPTVFLLVPLFLVYFARLWVEQHTRQMKGQDDREGDRVIRVEEPRLRIEGRTRGSREEVINHVKGHVLDSCPFS